MGLRDNHTKYEPKTQRWRPGTGFCNLGPKSAFVFFAQNHPRTKNAKNAKCGEIVATLHMQLDFLVPKGPLGPSNSTICPRTAPKRPPKAPEFVHIAPNRNQD